MLAGRRERLAGAGQLLLRQGVVSGELPAWLDVDAVTRGLLALLDGLMLQRIEAGDAYRPADLERRATAIVELLLARRPGAPAAPRSRSRRRSIAGHGPRPDRPRPDRARRRSGSPCRTSTPRSRCGTSESRWDYWQLTRDEPVILDELARFRAAGGSGLVDLTLPGVGRDPAWLRRPRRGERPARRHGLRLVSDGLLPARGAHRPAVGRRPRRRAGRARSRTGWGTPGVRPGIIGEIGTDKPWVSPAEERVHRAAARAARRTGLAITTHGVLSDVGLAQLRIFEEEGADPGAGRHRPRRLVPGPRPLPRDHRARREPRVRLPRDALAERERDRRDRARSSSSASCSARGHADRVLLSQDVCNDSQLTALRRQRLHLPRPTRSCRGSGRPACRDAEIETMTVANPRRLLTIG